jgi:hypothetical protein
LYDYISGNDLDKLPLVVSRNHDSHKFNRDTVWRFKVEKVGLGSYYGFKVDKNERILLADLIVSHNVCLYFVSLSLSLFFFKKKKQKQKQKIH